jgi:drug/metabolite transporter (DMT)-like permease
MIAASLWAIDAIFRTQLTYSIPSLSIVMFEHLLGFLILSPYFFRYFLHIKKMKASDWLVFLGLTVVSSVLGTVLFTEALARSFSIKDFITPILLLKLQPIFVILLSAFFLHERLSKGFIFYAIMALLGSYLMTFGTQIVHLSLSGRELVYTLAIGAALCWGSGTILSKKGLEILPYPAASALRFLLAVPIAFIFSVLLKQTYNFMHIEISQMWRFLVIAGITGGAFAIYLYYKGLKNTDAKVSTFAELMLPLVSLIIALTPLNPYGAPQTLSIPNVIGIIILVFAMLKISLKYNRSAQ